MRTRRWRRYWHIWFWAPWQIEAIKVDVERLYRRINAVQTLPRTWEGQ